MRVISVPGRLVRHPVTLRVIDEGGVQIDPHDLVWVNLIADGDVELVQDLPSPEPAPELQPVPDDALIERSAAPADAPHATEQE